MAEWNRARWQEIANRGIQDRLSPERKARFDEIVRRGLITIPERDTGVSPDIPTAENLALSRQRKEKALAEKPEESFTDKVLGVGEAGLSMLTGATGGAVGQFLGNLEGAGQYLLGNETPEQAQERAARYAESLTYTPRTETGQEIVGTVGEALGALPPVVAGVSPAQFASAGQSARSVAQVAPQAAKAATSTAAKQAADTIKSRSVGAAQTPQALMRVERAESLPVPVKLTKGQKTQELTQQKFERETAKTELGEDLRKRYTEQNEAIAMNIDAYVDATGTKLPDLQSAGLTGEVIDKALRGRAAKDKLEVRNAYKAVEKSPEYNELVNISPVADYLNENMAGASSSPIMLSFQKEAKRLGVADGDLNDGSFTVRDMTLGQSESLRKFINKFTDNSNATDIRAASELKSLIDQSTEGAGGKLYREARQKRANYARNYENIGLVRDLLGKKRGTDDRKIAIENVTDKIVNKGSVNDLRQIKRLLTSKEETREAWTELQAQTLRDLKQAASKNVGVSPDGTPLISASQIDKYVKRLDADGKLDLLFGKKAAQQIRDLRDVAVDVYVSQPGAVNYSNTASTIASMLDLMAAPLTMDFSGVPLPILTATSAATKKLKQQAVKSKVKKSLQ